MLKETGRLYERIHDAVAQHLISEDLAQWPHQVSLDPIDSRYADERASMPPPRVLSDASGTCRWGGILAASATHPRLQGPRKPRY
jgi:hypothetical protein